MSRRVLVSMASWEHRFVLGLEEECTRRIDSAVILFSREFEEWTRPNREKVRTVLQERGVQEAFKEITWGDHSGTFLSLVDEARSIAAGTDEVIIDISTMPRDILLTLLYAFRACRKPVQVVYNSPKSYAKDWLTRDPDRPRLIPKVSGVADLGRPTVLIVLTGFDVDRTNQMVHYFDPVHTYLGLQVGDQYENQEKNVSKHLNLFGRKASQFEIDAYSGDFGEGVLRAVLSDNVDANVIIGCLGPKPSAIAAFRLHVAEPRVGLAYVPAREYNLLYSSEIGDKRVRAMLDFGGS